MIYIKNPTAAAGGRKIYSLLFIILIIIIHIVQFYSRIYILKKNVYNTVRSTDYLRDYEVITVRYTYVY